MPKPARAEPVAPDARRTVRVWDIGVRLFHWSLVLSFVVAWLTRHGSEDIHHLAGYAAAALVALRLVWGVVGTHYARFAQFTRSPVTVLGYLRDIASGREARYLGHNPAGGAMILLLLVMMGGTALTGWMMTTDQFWGDDTIAHLHERLADPQRGAPVQRYRGQNRKGMQGQRPAYADGANEKGVERRKDRQCEDQRPAGLLSRAIEP